MPLGLQRYYGTGDLHFITCSCYRRQAWLGTEPRRDLFLSVLERTRKRYQFVVLGYVVMPEHFHLLISEPQEGTPGTVMQALKLGFARRVLAQNRARRRSAQASLFERTPLHVWQARFYDFNVLTSRKRVEDWSSRRSYGGGAVTGLMLSGKREWCESTIGRLSR
jgi:putative transposase